MRPIDDEIMALRLAGDHRFYRLVQKRIVFRSQWR